MNLPVHPLAGQRVGYARISSASQNLNGQTDALNAAGCEKIFADTASGKLTERPELTLCLGYLRAGDTLVVWRLDRLGRSLRHLVETVNALADRGVAFASLHEGIDTTTSTGRLVFHIFAALAEFERELIAERAAVGRAAARARGRLGGLPCQTLPGANQAGPGPVQSPGRHRGRDRQGAGRRPRHHLPGAPADALTSRRLYGGSSSPDLSCQRY